MKRRILSLLVGGLVAASAGAVQAAPLAFTGSLRIDWVNLPLITVAGSAIANVNGSGGGGHLSALSLAGGTFATTGLVIPYTDPAQAPIQGVQLTLGNGPGAFVDGASFGGVMPLIGAMKTCLFGPCGSAIANLTVPLGVVGAGGISYVTDVVNVSVLGAPWTTGTVAIATVTAMGNAAPASNTGAASGVLTLVTPIYVQTNISVGVTLPVFAYVDLHFVPEPSTLVLLGSGIASLLWFGAAAKQNGS